MHGDERDTTELVTVVTWNVKFGEQIEAAIDLLSAHPMLSGADALLLQELDGDGARRIASALALELHYEPACVHPQTGREFGNAILSRSPLRDRRVVPLPHTATISGTRRIAVAATTDLGHDVRLWCTHAEIPVMAPHLRRRQFRTVADVMRRDPAPMMILGGDFNTVTRRGVDTVSSMIRAAGLERARLREDATIRRAGRPLALDHVFHRGVTPVAAGVVEPGRASDHSAVWFRFRA
ncbi:MAG: endonuclease/exonuclease/phosphatase family protein [Actinomycetota bacterium]